MTRMVGQLTLEEQGLFVQRIVIVWSAVSRIRDVSLDRSVLLVRTLYLPVCGATKSWLKTRHDNAAFEWIGLLSRQSQ